MVAMDSGLVPKAPLQTEQYLVYIILSSVLADLLISKYIFINT